MVTVPASVWRFGPILRGVILGGVVGAVLGGLAWLDSGFWVTAVIVFTILCLFYGGWMSRRMSRYWPGARQLSGPQREQVVSAARAGRPVDDPSLTAALIGYRDGLHQAAEDSRPLRWVLPAVLVVAVATAVWDAAFGSWGNAVVSAIYLVALVVEMSWWPKRRRRLLANADRAVALAGERTE